MNRDYGYYDGENVKNFEHLPVISVYNANYYRGIGKDLLYAVSDDDMSTYWYVIQGAEKPAFIGYSIVPMGAGQERLEYTTEMPT